MTPTPIPAMLTNDQMKEILLAAGFKQHPLPRDHSEYAIAIFTKWCRNDTGKQYCVSAYLYDHSALPGYPATAPAQHCEFKSQMHDHDREGRVVNIQTSTSDPAELSDILQMFRRAWQTLGSIYKERYEA